MGPVKLSSCSTEMVWLSRLTSTLYTPGSGLMVSWAWETQEVQCKFVTRKVETSRFFGGGSGGMAADRALGEKNAMLGIGVLVMVV